MIELKCAICGSKEKTTLRYKETFEIKKITGLTFSARRTPDRQHFRIVECSRCGLVFSNPIFTPAKIHSWYEKSDFRYDKESLYLKKTYGFYLKKMLGNKNPEKLKLLEIGCGNGFFLEEALKVGFKNVYGVEPGKPSVKKARVDIKKNIKLDIFKPGLYKDNTFDIICCFHTLDHIIDIDSFLTTTKKILKKGGKVFFIVHNTDGLSVRIFGEKSPIFDIEHIYLFNPKTLLRLFMQYGFRKGKVFSIANTYPLDYWFRLFPLPNKIKVPFMKILSLSKLGNIPIKLNAGNIGIIATNDE